MGVYPAPSMAALNSSDGRSLTIRTRLAPRSISHVPSASTSFTARVMVEAQCPHVMSFTLNSIIRLLLSWHEPIMHLPTVGRSSPATIRTTPMESLFPLVGLAIAVFVASDIDDL